MRVRFVGVIVNARAIVFLRDGVRVAPSWRMSRVYTAGIIVVHNIHAPITHMCRAFESNQMEIKFSHSHLIHTRVVWGTVSFFLLSVAHHFACHCCSSVSLPDRFDGSSSSTSASAESATTPASRRSFPASVSSSTAICDAWRPPRHGCSTVTRRRTASFPIRSSRSNGTW